MPLRTPTITDLSEPAQTKRLVETLRRTKVQAGRTAMSVEPVRSRPESAGTENRFRVVDSPAAPGGTGHGELEVHFNVAPSGKTPVWKKLTLTDL